MTVQETARPQATGLTDEAVRLFVYDWFLALDQHFAPEQVLPMVAPDPTVVLPEGRLHTTAEFADWYHAVTHRFFDEKHTLKRLDVTLVSPAEARVSLVVNWQARVWDPPADQSSWLGFDATQDWTIVLRDGAPRIAVYDVRALDPMPGSATL
jgi:hypothetical protein